jgi:hypothetical protein
MTGPRKRAFAVVCAGLLAAAAVGTSAAAAGPAHQARVVDGLDGPRGLDIAGGKTVVAESNGAISQVIRSGPDKGTTERIGKVVKGFGSAVAIAPNGDVWAVTGEGDARLFLFREGHKRQEVADIGRYQKKQNKDPFNLADPPGQSNPFNLASMDDGSVLVADAANNSVVHVTRKGKITPVARVKPRTVPMPEGFDNPDLPPAGTPLPSEAVTTSVAVGPDGAIYIGELRGFPGTPETSQIWKVRPGATDAVCKPNKPNKGACTRFADGLTSIVALEMGRGGSLYAAELSKLSWLAAEFEVPGAEVGAIIRVGRDPQVRRELSPGKVILPGGVAVGGNGNVFVSGPVFGPGSVKKVG